MALPSVLTAPLRPVWPGKVRILLSLVLCAGVVAPSRAMGLFGVPRRMKVISLRAVTESFCMATDVEVAAMDGCGKVSEPALLFSIR